MSARSVTIEAHPNIALAKYWGKRRGPGNFPAVPSLSVTLAGLSTTTRLTLREDLAADRLSINGDEMQGEGLARTVTLLDRVRAASGLKLRAAIESTNDFPTASGLASSASGFAALALAAVRAAGLGWDTTQVSDLARRTSASAARSLFGGYVELDAGVDDAPESTPLPARPLVPGDHLPLRVLVCVTTESSKTTSSSDGMRATAALSPYYPVWLEDAPRNCADLRAALLARDFEKLGALAERSALAMHASAIAAGAVYWNGVTIEALTAVRQLRARGTPAFATIDAGPHVKVLVKPDDAALAGTWLRAVPGVLRVIECAPGDGARVVASGDGPEARRGTEERAS